MAKAERSVRGSQAVTAVLIGLVLIGSTFALVAPVGAQGGGGTTILPPGTPNPPFISCSDLFNSDDGILFGSNLINTVPPCTFPDQCPDCFGFVSTDPNDKAGSAGVASFLAGATPLRYAVYFENVETATAAAQDVVITDPLDTGDLDLGTLSLGPILIGTKTIVPTPGLTSFTGDLDLRPDVNVIARINAALDPSTGVLTWRFATIDPATGQPTTDPAAGFLPPNITPPQGQGTVVFTVMPKAGVTTGTQICNQASIVFDVNAPISTPAWCNSVDNTPPTSHVLSLAATQSTATFSVQWAGSDAGAGIKNFSVFVSENGGAFTPFQQNTAVTSAAFTGQLGRTYGFFSVATDGAGNVESKPAVAEASTQLLLPGDLNGDGVVNCTDLAIVKASFGKRTGMVGFDPRADTNHDGIVNIVDLAFVSRQLPAGTKCP